MKDNLNLITDWELKKYQIMPVSQLTTKVKWKRLSEKFIYLIKKNCRQESLVLDIGGGAGLFYYFIKDICKLYVSIDPSEKAIQYFKYRDHNYICQSCGENLPFKSELFDVVLLKAALDHCFDPEIVLSESRRVLKEKGKIFILLTNEKAWYKILFKKYNLDKKKKYTGHNFYFSSDEINELLEKNDFRDIYMQHFDFFRAPIVIENIAFRFIPEKMLWFFLNITDKIMRECLPFYGGTFICVATK